MQLIVTDPVRTYVRRFKAQLPPKCLSFFTLMSNLQILKQLRFVGFLRLLSYSHKNIGRENKNVSFRDVNHKRFAIYYCNVDVKDIIETCTFAFMHFEYHSHRSFLQIP